MEQDGARVGAVGALWRYPVKAMGGEEIEAASVGRDGLVGDRGFALVSDTEGTVGSGKEPGRWGRLLGCSSAYAQPPRPGEAPPPALVTLPDGSRLSTADPDADALLSAFLGHPVRFSDTPPREALADYLPVDEGGGRLDQLDRMTLAEAAPGTFLDYAPVHLVTDTALARLGEAHEAPGVDVRRFRPNIVVTVDDRGAGFVEHDWVGCDLGLGPEAVLRVFKSTPRCVVPTLATGDLGEDRGLLRTIARHNRILVEGSLRNCAGVYARVVRGGTVRLGDTVTVR